MLCYNLHVSGNSQVKYNFTYIPIQELLYLQRFGAGFMGNLTGIIYNNRMAAFSYVTQTDTQERPANPYNYVEPGK